MPSVVRRNPLPSAELWLLFRASTATPCREWVTCKNSAHLGEAMSSFPRIRSILLQFAPYFAILKTPQKPRRRRAASKRDAVLLQVQSVSHCENFRVLIGVWSIELWHRFVSTAARVRNSATTSHAHNVTKRRWNVNLQPVKAVVNGATKRVRVCTGCIKSGKVTKALVRKTAAA